MKKIQLLFIISVLIVSGSVAQNIRIIDDHGGDITGSTITINGPLDQMFQVHLGVKNLAGDTLRVKARKKDSILVSGSYVMLCWGICSAPDVNESPITIPIASGATNTSAFSGDYYANNNTGTSTIVFTFFNANDTNDKASIIVKFAAQAANINDVPFKSTRFSNALPNPANDLVRFNYSLSKDVTTAKIVIYDLLGNQVLEKECTEAEGSMVLYTSDINNGVYFYSVIINGTAISSRKLIIKH